MDNKADGHYRERAGLVSDEVVSFWRVLPVFLVRFGGAAIIVTFFTVSMKGDAYTDVPWWIVLSPVAIALSVFFFVFTMAVFAWIRLAVLLLTGNAEVDGNREVRLDVLFRSAKVCFLGHGYVQLLMLSFGLLLLKLSIWPNLPVVYPLLPLIVLGFVYVFLAVMLQQPEVDPAWYSIVGMSLLSQSIMLVIKLDHLYKSKRLPWAATFTPAWLTYVLLLVYCVVSPFQANTQEAVESSTSRSASSSGSRYGSMTANTGGSRHGSSKSAKTGTRTERFKTQLQKVAGIGAWSIGCGISQVLLTMRLEDLYKVSWLAVLLPAILGWMVLLIFVADLVSGYFKDIVDVFLDMLGIFSVCNDQESCEAWSFERSEVESASSRSWR